MSKQIRLPDAWCEKLLNYPETGMGYQVVKVVLKSGKVLHHRKVLNASVLLLEERDEFILADIGQIVPENI